MVPEVGHTMRPASGTHGRRQRRVVRGRRRVGFVPRGSRQRPLALVLSLLLNYEFGATGGQRGRVTCPSSTSESQPRKVETLGLPRRSE